MYRKIACATCRVILVADVNEPFQERSGRQNYFTAKKPFPDLGLDPLQLAALDDERFDASLSKR
jgi:hypothetical protein